MARDVPAGESAGEPAGESAGGSGGWSGAVPSGAGPVAATPSGPGVYTPLPEGLDVMPPGPELAAVLAGLDRALFNGYQFVGPLQGRQRQVARGQAPFLAQVH